MGMRNVNVFERSVLAGADTFLTAVAGFRIFDDGMVVPQDINFPENLPWAYFQAIPAALAAMSIQADELGLPCARNPAKIHAISFISNGWTGIPAHPFRSLLLTLIRGLACFSMGAFVPLGEHGRDEIALRAFFIPTAVAHVPPAPARAPDHAAQRAKGQEDQEQTHQRRKTAEAEKGMEVAERHSIAVRWQRLAVGGHLDIQGCAARHPGVEGEKGDPSDGGQQNEASHNPKNDIFEHFISPVEY